MNAVFFEANDDPTTSAVHTARRKVLTSMSCYPERHLFGNDAHYVDVQNARGALGAFGLFSGMGHGGPDHFTGQRCSFIFDLADTKKVNRTTSGAIVHLFSCDCGQSLGPHLIRSGAKAFVGYLNPVNVPSLAVVVEEFVKVAGVIDRSILSGDSHALTKAKADAESRTVEATLRTSASATPRDVASFRLNQRALVGTWSDPKYGSY